MKLRFDRVNFPRIALSLAAIVLLVNGTSAQTLESLAGEAARGAPVLWYESTNEETIAPVIAAFNKEYPNVKLQHLTVAGGMGVSGRVIQESEANAATADVITTTAEQIAAMEGRKVLIPLNWDRLRIGPEQPHSATSVLTAAVLFGIVYNTNLVAEKDLPQSWSDILDPRWKGKFAMLPRSDPFSALAKAWGYQRTRDLLVEFLAKQAPRFSTNSTSDVVTGEAEMTFQGPHSAAPFQRNGAPIKFKSLDITPVTPIYSAAVRAGRNQAGAQLFIAWLHSPTGNVAYEKATVRSSPYVLGTESGKILQGLSTSMYGLEETEEANRIASEFNDLALRASRR